MKIDTQDEKPVIAEHLRSVGVTNLKTLVQTNWEGHPCKFVPKIQLTVDLPEDRKGAHMSRLIESISESIEEESVKVHESLEILQRRILERLTTKHMYNRGEITFETELVLTRKTPYTRRNTMEAHDIIVTTVTEAGHFYKILKARVLGSTVCPHAIQNTGGKPHIQRAIAELEVKAGIDEKIRLEELIDICDESFSSPVFTLLKTEDESSVIETMYSNPKFVEDVCRELLSKSKERFKNVRVKARAISQESIHRHDVIAEGSVKI